MKRVTILVAGIILSTATATLAHPWDSQTMETYKRVSCSLLGKHCEPADTPTTTRAPQQKGFAASVHRSVNSAFSKISAAIAKAARENHNERTIAAKE